MALMWLLIMAVFLSYIARKSIYDLHMLQLNSYRNDRYMHFLRKDKLLRVRKADFALFVGGLFFCFNKGWFGLSLLLAIELVLLLSCKTAPQKKPLVMTQRAKRLYIACVVLETAAAIALYFLGRTVYAAALLIVLTIFSFGFIMLANILLAPVEKHINESFLKDAKRKLASMPLLTVIGITGSFGKTSGKMILGEILKEKYMTLVTPASFNTPMGLTRAIREKLQATDEFFIAEMGAKQVGDIKELCDLTHPQAGIITAVGEQHLQSFKSLENIIKTKFELMQALPADGVLFANIDNENIVKGLELPHQCKVIKYSLNGKGDYNACDIRVSAKGSSFTVITPEGELGEFQTALLGRHNIENILGAVACAHYFGVSLKEAARAVKTLPQIEHRLSLKQTAGGINIIDDAFNSNPAGSKAALEVLSAFEGGDKIIITPGMIELGEKSAELNREFGKNCAKVCDYIILVGRKQTEPIREGVLEMGFDEAKLFVAADLTEARVQMAKWAKAGDTVLFENDLTDDYNEKK